jgi:hypothetical protein
MRMRGRGEEIQHAASIGSESIATFECYTTWAWAVKYQYLCPITVPPESVRHSLIGHENLVHEESKGGCISAYRFMSVGLQGSCILFCILILDLIRGTHDYWYS